MIIEKDGKKYKVVELVDENNGKSDALIEFEKWENETYCMEAVKRNGYSLRYVKDQTESMCMEAVIPDGYSLRYVKDHPESMCMEAVKQDGDSLQYVKSKSTFIKIEKLL